MFMYAAKWIVTNGKDKVYYHTKYNPSHLPQGMQTKIFCLHGTADRVSAFEFLAEGMIKNLPNNIASIHIVSFEGRGQGYGIDYFAKQLIDKIKKSNNSKKNKDDMDDIILMGHSRGGLIAAYFAEYLAKEAKINVRAVFTIGSPFGGSSLAVWPLTWISTSIHQMQIDSDFLKSLVKKIQQSDIVYYHVAARNDAIVSLDSTYSKRNNPAIIFHNNGHLSLMTSPELLDYLIYHITQLVHVNESLTLCKMSDEDILKMVNDMVFVNHDDCLTLIDACTDVEFYINELKSRIHLFSATAKIEILTDLLKLLNEQLNSDNIDNSIHSIGDFIAYFLQSKSSDNVQTRLEILNTPLNYPFTFFQHTESISKHFIENLITKYKSVPFLNQKRLNLSDKVKL